MTDTVTTRIELPAEVHREVKAEAARHGVNLADALGMCVAFLCDLTTPLMWRMDEGETVDDLDTWVKKWDRNHEES